MNRATTGEADGEGLVVAVAERDQLPGTIPDALQCLDDDGTLDTSTTDRTSDVAIFVDGHRGAWKPRTRTFDIDDSSNGYLLALLPPAVKVSQDFTHVSRLL